MQRLLVYIFLFLFAINLSSQTQEVPYTLADRDRLIQVEADIQSLRNEMNSLRNEMNTNMQSIDQRFENIENRLDDQKTFLYWGFGILFSFMLFLVGFVLWDRRSMIKPLNDEVETLKRENEKMKEIFRKQAEIQPQLWEILKNAGIL
ncbi:MAG: hypothetical protein K9H16_11995 [Bacteroidales bacterium]|nr:hypothetical protein [Bacteroidales bacterium]